MTATVYTFHAAYDHSIVAAFEFEADAITHHARQQALLDAESGSNTRRYYIHNGVGIVAAFMTRNGEAHQILRDDYMQFKGKADEARKAL